jgi:hypothetical protein
LEDNTAITTTEDRTHILAHDQKLDWTGRAILENKRGFTSSKQPPMLERLQIDPKNWLYMTQKFESQFRGLVGAVNALKATCEKFNYRRTTNLASCQQLLV